MTACTNGPGAAICRWEQAPLYLGLGSVHARAQHSLCRQRQHVCQMSCLAAVRFPSPPRWCTLRACVGNFRRRRCRISTVCELGCCESHTVGATTVTNDPKLRFWRVRRLESPIASQDVLRKAKMSCEKVESGQTHAKKQSLVRAFSTRLHLCVSSPIPSKCVRTMHCSSVTQPCWQQVPHAQSPTSATRPMLFTRMSTQLRDHPPTPTLFFQ